MSSSTVISKNNSWQRIAFGSCFNPNRGDDIWELIAQFAPNQLLLLGDQIYADFHPKTGFWQKSTPEIIRKEYEKFFKLPGWKSLVEKLSHGWISTYDDHDYGNNNADKTWKYRKEAMDAFREFNKDHFTPVPFLDENGQEIFDGVYSSKDFIVPTPEGNEFRYTVILLDSRSNKDPKGTTNGDFLGSRQWEWLTSELDRASKTSNLILLGSSIQVIPNEKLLEETWNEFPAARQRLLELITKISLRTNIFLLSGDIHSAELSQTTCYATLRGPDSETVVVPRRLMEFTSSGLSHTFVNRMDVQKIHDVAKLKKSQRQSTTQVPYTNYLPSLIYSRGYLSDVLFNVYQISNPSNHRANRYSDIYTNLHFSTLDIQSSSGGNAAVSYDASFRDMNDLWHTSPVADMEWRTVNFDGKTVQFKRLPLFDTFHQPQGVVTYNGSSLDLNRFTVADVQCVNIQGAQPLWRSLLERMTLTTYVLVFFLIPILWILWFVFASIFYLSWGREMKRRQILEDRYQKMNKPKQH